MSGDCVKYSHFILHFLRGRLRGALVEEELLDEAVAVFSSIGIDLSRAAYGSVIW